jgi:hypothetical protein
LKGSGFWFVVSGLWFGLVSGLEFLVSGFWFGVRVSGRMSRKKSFTRAHKQNKLGHK